jgi:hypothetical protein
MHEVGEGCFAQPVSSSSPPSVPDVAPMRDPPRYLKQVTCRSPKALTLIGGALHEVSYVKFSDKLATRSYCPVSAQARNWRAARRARNGGTSR